GLGSESNLTLVDGHRLAYDGNTGSVDISQIPLAAVERVEIIPDGASATYGSDAVSGVVNFIMRRDFNGLQASATAADSTDGGGSQQIYNAFAGKTWSGENGLFAYEHAHQNSVDSAARSFVPPIVAGTSLTPQTRRDSVFASAEQDVAAGVSVFTQGLYTNR